MVCQVFIKYNTTSHLNQIAEIKQLNLYNKVNLFNRRVPVVATIFWETNRDASIDHKTGFPAIIFSYRTRGIYFLIRVHNYTKIKGLDSGKITSLPNSENVINLHALFQSSPKINRMLITRLICIHGEYFMESAGVRYLRTSCWRIRNRTSERSERVRFLIQKQRVRKYCTKHFPCGIVFIIYILRFKFSFIVFNDRPRQNSVTWIQDKNSCKDYNISLNFCQKCNITASK